MPESEVFEQIYQDYLSQIARINLHRVQDRLGLRLDKGEAIIPVYGFPHRISPQGIVNHQSLRPSHAVSVLLSKYLLCCPENEPTESDWVTYKDFKDAAPYAGGFLNSAERPISSAFAGRLSDLKQACRTLSGRPDEIGISCDLAIRFDALPKVPVLLLFNDQDEDFPAHCSLLFERRAEKYLDMECLAITGLVLAEWLKRQAEP